MHVPHGTTSRPPSLVVAPYTLTGNLMSEIFVARRSAQPLDIKNGEASTEKQGGTARTAHTDSHRAKPSAPQGLHKLTVPGKAISDKEARPSVLIFPFNYSA
jgi:hypothetical protein